MTTLSLQAFFATSLLCIYIFSAHIIERRKFRYLHESALAIIIGIICGVLIALLQNQAIAFHEEIFFNLILPPIIFAAGYTLKKKHFFENIAYILFYGVVGTICSFIILTAFCAVFAKMGLVGHNRHFTIYDCMMLSVILSSTDTVAPLSLVKEKHYPTLNSILFGEGVVNDAVSILLFRTIRSFVRSKSGLSFGTLLSVSWEFLSLAVASLAIGVGCGLFVSFIFRRNPSFKEFPLREVSLIMMFGYLSYLVSELMHFSGIISLFSCGITMAHYTWHNISEESQKGTNLVFDTVGHVAEAFVFVYLGLSIYLLKDSEFSLPFSIAMIVAIFITRFFVVFLPPVGMCLMRKASRLKVKDYNIIWYGGLIRGAIAFALSFQVVSENKSVIITTTVFVVLITSLVLTVLLQSFSKYIGLRPTVSDRSGSESGHDLQSYLLNEDPSDRVLSGSRRNSKQLHRSSSALFEGESQKGKEKRKLGLLHKKWKHFDEKVMKPLFGGRMKESSDNDKSGH